jgi:hypothetical protein
MRKQLILWLCCIIVAAGTPALIDLLPDIDGFRFFRFLTYTFAFVGGETFAVLLGYLAVQAGRTKVFDHMSAR